MPMEDNTEDLHGRIVRVSREPRVASRGGYLFRGLEIARESCDQRVFVMFPVYSGKAYEFPLLCHEGLHIAMYGLHFNNRLDDGSAIYTVTSNTDLILEPRRLVSVTEAVEAAGCVKSVDLRFRVGPDEPFWMAKGKLIHHLMEHILRGCKEDDFEAVFCKVLPSFIAILPGSAISADIESLRDEVKSHFDNLTKWLERESGSFDAVETEADRISTRWGMKGRIDAILFHNDQRTILELKTGRSVSERNLLQLYAYSLLCGNGENCPPGGFVFYSAKNRADPLKELGEDARNIIIDGRNKVLALKHSYTLGTGSNYYGQIDDVSCGEPARCFSRRNCALFYGSPPETGKFTESGEREYYDRWFKLLSVEDWEAEGDFARVLDPSTLQQRIEDGTTLMLNTVRFRNFCQRKAPGEYEIDYRVDPGIHMSSDEPSVPSANLDSFEMFAQFSAPTGTTSDLQPGEEVLLHFGDPCSEDALRGRVIHSENEITRVSLKGCSSVNISRSLQGRFSSERVFLDRIPFSRPRQTARQALFRFFSKADRQVVRCVVRTDERDGTAERLSPVDHLVKTEAPGPETAFDLGRSEDFSPELNQDQLSTIKAAVDCETFHLIHGPPGTGKTRVLAGLIRLCLDRGERLLVACPTNVALDRLLVAAMRLGIKDLLRVGSRSTASMELLEIIKGMGNPHILLEDLSRRVSDCRAFIKSVHEMPLIGATAYQCAAHPIFLRQKFHRVILDEAGQLDEPSALAPLSLAPKFILCGDHLQLPPVVQTRTDPEAAERGLEQSLFERLYLSAAESKISRLRMQYRMNEDVQSLPSRLFYGGKLVASPDTAKRKLMVKAEGSDDPQMNRIVDPEHSVVFVDVNGSQVGKARPEEAGIAGRIVETLLKSGISPAEIGIITPYKAQQALIRGCLARRGIENSLLSVDTVDRFQGGEREVIILSLARSDGVTSFLADKKRLNVSLSRARSKLILLGHATSLGEHPLFQSLLEGLERVQIDAGTSLT